jgi:HEAT repeat protein
MSFLQGLFGPPDIAKMKAKRDVKGLIKALSYQEDVNVRWQAAKALGELKDAHAVEPLIAALKFDTVRETAARTLDGMGWKPGKDSIGAEYWIAKQNWEECILVGSPAVEPLIAALKDENADVRRKALESLEKIGWQPGKDESSAAYWLGRHNFTECIKIGAPAVGQLIIVLLDEEWNERAAAAEALGKIGDARAVEPLIAALISERNIMAPHPSPGELRIGPTPQAKEEDGACREIVRALGELKAADAVELLVKIANEEHWRSAIESLGQIGDARAVAPLITILNDERLDRFMQVKMGKEEYLRAYAASALGELKDVRAVAPLIAALGDKNSSVSRCAAEALGKFGIPAVEPLFGALKNVNPVVCSNAASALGRIGDARAVEPLIAALKDSAEYVRADAADALGKIGDTSAMEPLIPLLKENSVNVRRKAAAALVSLYQTGKLDEARKKLLIAHQYEMPAHIDITRSTTDNCGGYVSEHTDMPAIIFPL